MRNERSYNSSLGPTRVGAIQTPVSVAPKTARVSLVLLMPEVRAAAGAIASLNLDA